jgi:methylenetetrahydrofolate--tRNA-(uracil-5-)-methyltransferase
MNVNFGLFPPLEAAISKGPNGERLRGTAKAIARKKALTSRARADLAAWIDATGRHAEAAE